MVIGVLQVENSIRDDVLKLAAGDKLVLVIVVGDEFRDKVRGVGRDRVEEHFSEHPQRGAGDVDGGLRDIVVPCGVSAWGEERGAGGTGGRSVWKGLDGNFWCATGGVEAGRVS